MIYMIKGDNLDSEAYELTWFPETRIYKLPQWCSYVRDKINPLLDHCTFVYVLPMAFIACAPQLLLLATCDLSLNVSENHTGIYTLYIGNCN